MISKIVPLSNSIDTTIKSPIAQEGSSSDFMKIFDNAINDLKEVEQNTIENTEKILSGEDINLHSVIIDMEKADLQFSLSMQVRNKIISAYEDIMDLQI